jgi:hypothetical protein
LIILAKWHMLTISLQKFLVDNAWSMNSHWGRVKYGLKTLVMKAEGLDEDGIDLIFSHGKVNAKDARQKAADTVINRLNDPKAVPHEKWRTDMKLRLGEIFEDHIRDVESKKKTI